MTHPDFQDWNKELDETESSIKVQFDFFIGLLIGGFVGFVLGIFLMTFTS